MASDDDAVFTTRLMAFYLSDMSSEIRQFCAARCEPFVEAEEHKLEYTKLFNEYLTGDEWTCADAEAPPQVLVDGLALATPEVGDALLMSVVSGAALPPAGGRGGRTSRRSTRRRTARTTRSPPGARAARPGVPPRSRAESSWDCGRSWLTRRMERKSPARLPLPSTKRWRQK